VPAVEVGSPACDPKLPSLNSALIPVQVSWGQFLSADVPRNSFNRVSSVG
jgi:hypothetical protein